jgi:hypothetical protein
VAEDDGVTMKGTLETLRALVGGSDASVMDLMAAHQAVAVLERQVRLGMGERAKSWGDIRQAARNSPLLYRFVQMVDQRYLTEEQAMATMVLHLDQEQRDEHQRKVADLHSQVGPKFGTKLVG